MSIPPLLSLILVADNSLKPAGLYLGFGEGDANALLPLIEDNRFADLATAFPCLISENLARRLSPELLAVLQGKSCRIISDEQSCRSDDQDRPAFPPAAEWLLGNWYLAPPSTTAASQASSQSLSLKLLQLVATDAETREIEAIFRQDPVLAYHLLRLVNSFGVGVGRHISSFSQAILILGRQQLKRWLNLMLFAASKDDRRSAMLLARVSVRARATELLAKACGLDRPAQEQAFMSGMFSLLGVLFALPLAEVLRPLKLNDSLSSAVIEHKGELGRLLAAVESSENADEYTLSQLLAGLGLSIADFNPLNLEAHQWMLGVIRGQEDTANA